MMPQKSFPDQDIVRIHLSFLAHTDISLKGNGGEALHGLFFGRLQFADPALANRIHSAVHKPFSLFPASNSPSSHPDPNPETTFSSGSTFSVTLNIFDPSLARIVLRALSQKPSQLALSDGFVSIADIRVHSTSFRALLESPDQPPRFRLQFLTPTCFRQKGRSIVFPEPDILFRSLLRRWNALSPRPLPENRKHLFPTLIVSRYRLETRVVPFSRYLIVGFVGYSEYIVPEALAEDERTCIYALARFAEYAGVGYKTTMGLGATRFQPQFPEPRHSPTKPG